MQIPRKEESWMDVFIVFYYIFAFDLCFIYYGNTIYI